MEIQQMHIRPIVMAVNLLLAFGAMQTAQAQATEEAAAPQYYQVEMILFRHVDQARTTPEIPRVVGQEIGEILDQDLPRLDQPDSEVADDTGVAPPRQLQAFTVDSSQYLLQDVSNQLRRLGAYEVLGHTAWLQAAPDVATAWSLDLADLELSPAIASGTVKLYKRRYLHFAVDVELGSGKAPTPFDNAFQTLSAPSAAPAIADSRRMRLDRLVYFDQPQFGVLAYVGRSDFQPQVTAD